MTCWKCGKSGHMRKDCRNKQIDPSLASMAIAKKEDGGEYLLDDDYAL